MDLKQFVQSTLVEIIEGVKQAQALVTDSGATINATVGMGPYEDKYETQHIEFDVAVTAGESSEAKGAMGAGILVLPFRLGAKASAAESETSSTVSRIRFKVPVQLPRRAPGQGIRANAAG